MEKINFKKILVVLISPFILNAQLNIKQFKKAIASTESKHESYNAFNPSTNACGKYQFLWRYIPVKFKQGHSINSFLRDSINQERLMDHHIQNVLIPYAEKYKEKYPSHLPLFYYASLIHWQGEYGAQNILKFGRLKSYLYLIDKQYKNYSNDQL